MGIMRKQNGETRTIGGRSPVELGMLFVSISLIGGGIWWAATISAHFGNLNSQVLEMRMELVNLHKLHAEVELLRASGSEPMRELTRNMVDLKLQLTLLQQMIQAHLTEPLKKP
jgi:hypothetical protein